MTGTDADVVPVLHLIEGAEGISQFSDPVVPLTAGACAPPARVMPVSDVEPHTGLLYLVLPAGWGGAQHPSPRRQGAFCLSGRLMMVQAGDGETREFGAGAIWRMEDVVGTGHTTTVVGREGARLAIVQLTPQPGDPTDTETPWTSPRKPSGSSTDPGTCAIPPAARQSSPRTAALRVWPAARRRSAPMATAWAITAGAPISPTARSRAPTSSPVAMDPMSGRLSISSIVAPGPEPFIRAPGMPALRAPHGSASLLGHAGAGWQGGRGARLLRQRQRRTTAGAGDVRTATDLRPCNRRIQ